MKRLSVIVPALLLVSSLMLSGCGAPASPQAIDTNALGSNNVMACTSFNVVFLGESKTQAIARQNASNAIYFGERAENPAVRAAAFRLRAQSNAGDKSGIDAAMGAFALACHKMGVGPGDNTGG